MATVEFLFDFGSPNTYLAHRAIPVIEGRSDIRFEYVPILLGGVFKLTNNVSPAVSLQGIRNKPEYATIETERFLKEYGVSGYTPNPHFPVNTLALMRAAVYAKEQDFFEAYVEAMYQCMWEQALKMDEPDIFTEALNNHGLPTREILEAITDPNVKQGLLDNTNTAVDRGTFGAPTFFLGDEIYFGKEKLRDIEDAVSRA